MAPRLRSPTLETRTARLKLKVRRKPYFVSVAPGDLARAIAATSAPDRGSCAAPMARVGRGRRGFPQPTISRTPAASRFSTSGRRRSAPASWCAASTPTPAKPVAVAQALGEYERDLAAPWRTGHPYPAGPPAARPRRCWSARSGSLVMRELRRWRDSRLARGLAAGYRHPRHARRSRPRSTMPPTAIRRSPIARPGRSVSRLCPTATSPAPTPS